ncbi:Tautomerase [Penicillium argentinense]|uniref:L-dopachrome isomerase n=1 Tax=Penicillium argentinense TaxID=1131581 RepID=A0A9W9FH26_9EURO|nr:Tautomerase [Penicillium argentinense]KAJ5100011.1 Tautomerase [Penicillium argentinense]
MDSSKEKKPTLPRLDTNLPPASAPAPGQPGTRRSVFDRRFQRNPDRSDLEPEKLAGLGIHPLFREDEITTDENAIPGSRFSPKTIATHVKQKSAEETSATTKKKEGLAGYYEEAFSSRGSHNSPRERVIQESAVIVELTTNREIKILDLLTEDFCDHLALIFQRPRASVYLTIQQCAALSFSNTSLPGYLLKVYTLPSLMAPLTNMRYTSLLADEMQELLDIGPEQGVILLLAVPEDNFAAGGATASGEILRIERAHQEESLGLFRSFGKQISRRRLKSSSGDTSGPLSPPTSSIQSPPTGRGLKGFINEDIATVEQRVEQRPRLGMKKSVQNFFGRRRLFDRSPVDKNEDQDTAKGKNADNIQAYEQKDQEEENQEENQVEAKPKNQERVKWEDEERAKRGE